MTHKRTRNVRRILSHWGPWMAVAYFGIVAAFVTVVILFGKTVKEAAVHASTTKQCLNSRPTLTKFAQQQRGLNQLADALVANADAVLAATSPDDPQHQTRIDNRARIMEAQKNIAAFKGINVPTKAACKSLP